MTYMNQKERNVLLKESRGVSQLGLELPIDFRPLADLLILVTGSEAVKAEALNWLLSEGLMEASIGRQKLYLMVMDARDTKPKTTVGNSNPAYYYKKVDEMAKNIEDIRGAEYSELLQPTDLFSKEAWQSGNLQSFDKFFKEKYGKGILDYYKENFEPKEMIINSHNKRNTRYAFNLEEMRDAAIKNGMRPFYYGGLNGYIQYTEKGDWLPKVKKRSLIARNQQFGPSLEPPMIKDKSGKFVPDFDNIKEIKNGQIQYNFDSGSYRPSNTTAADHIAKMRLHFIKAASNHPNLSEEDRQHIQSISSLISQMEKQEKSLSAIKGHHSMARKAGFPRYVLGQEYQELFELPPNIDEESFKDLVRKGLNLPFLGIKKNKFNKLERLGPPISKAEKAEYEKKYPNSGYYIENENSDTVTIKFNARQRDAIFNAIFRKIDKGLYRARFRYASLTDESIVALEPKKDAKFVLSTLLNNYLSSDRKIQESLKQTVFKIPKLQAPYAKSVSEAKLPLGKEFNPLKNQTLQKLFDSGFKWSLTKPQIKKKQQHPFVDYFQDQSLKAPIGFLVNPAGIKLRVEKEDDGVWYLYLPSKQQADLIKLQGYGIDKNAPLMAKFGTSIHGGQGSGHINALAVSDNVWKSILKELLAGCQGKMGECESGKEGPFKDETELPSVLGGVQMAKSNFNKLRGPATEWFNKHVHSLLGGTPDYMDHPANYFAQDDLLKYATNALKMFSNDPAFQIGWINQEEWNEFTRKKINLKNQQVQSQLFGQQQGQRSGIGIRSILTQLGILNNDPTDPDNDQLFNVLQNLVNTQVNKIRTSGKSLNDFFILPTLSQILQKAGEPSYAEITKAFASNGLEYRKRKIAEYVIKVMDEQLNKLRKNIQEPMPTQKGEDSDLDVPFDFEKSRHTELRGDYEDDIDQIKDISQIHNLLNVKDTDLVNPNIPKSNLVSVRGGQQRVSQPKNLGLGQKPKVPTPPSKKTLLQPPNWDDLSHFDEPPVKPTASTTPATPKKSVLPSWDEDLNDFEESQIHSKPLQDKLMKYSDWSSHKTVQEMIGTGMIYDKRKRKPAAGSGFNWWGEPGNIGGTSISGEVDTVNSDPDGKKGIKNVRKRK